MIEIFTSRYFATFLHHLLKHGRKIVRCVWLFLFFLKSSFANTFTSEIKGIDRSSTGKPPSALETNQKKDETKMENVSNLTPQINTVMLSSSLKTVKCETTETNINCKIYAKICG